MDRLRVLTLNIYNREADWQARRGVIRRGVAELQPDLVGLQEVLRSTTSGLDQAREIAEGLGYQLAHAAARPFEDGVDFGNALLSRHPIVETQVLPLPGAESGDPRCALYARLDTPLGLVPAFVTHLAFRPEHGAVRVRQVQALATWVAELAPLEAGYPAVVMGDFNALPDSDEIRYLRGLATLDGGSVFFADAWEYGGDGSPGYTVDRRNPLADRSHKPSRRLDYVFVHGAHRTRGGEPMTCRLALDAAQDGVWASDHFGVYTELSVRS